jgi:hypothetical protein
MPQLPATLKPGKLATAADTHLVPALIADAGEPAAWRYVEFFTANIRNPNTRRAYARACGQFFAWCEDRGLALTTIRPFDVATYIEALQQTHSAPGVKQQLAAVRMLFDWLITGQVVPVNPACEVVPIGASNSTSIANVCRSGGPALQPGCGCKAPINGRDRCPSFVRRCSAGRPR